MGTGTPEGTARAAATRAARRAALDRALVALGPTVCRLPGCGRDVVPTSGRGPEQGTGARGQDDGAARPADGNGPTAGPEQSGGRRAEYCSEGHRRANGRAVRELRAMLVEALALRDDTPLRERKAVDAQVAAIGRRLVAHGDAVPATGRPTSSPPTPAPGPASPRADVRGARHRPVPRRVGPPVLAVWPDGDVDDLYYDWDSLRNANDRTRHLVDEVSRARTDGDRQRMVAQAWDRCFDLIQATDQVVGVLVPLRRRD